VTVYILEAHAEDQWPIGAQIKYNQHKTIEERLAAAHDLVKFEDWKFEVKVDTMDNTFEDTFASWPTRLYVLHNGQLMFKSHEDDRDEGEEEETSTYDEVGALAAFLDSWLPSLGRKRTRE